MTNQHKKKRNGRIWGFIGIMIVCSFIGGALVLFFGYPYSWFENGAPDVASTPIEPTLTSTPTITPDLIILVWGNQGEHLVLESETQYWDKYQSDPELPGLYLRTDSINSFGDYLEIFPGGIFSLELDNRYLTGIWALEG
jgi:hypothetical protein